MSEVMAYETMRALATLELLADAPRSTTQIADELAIHPRTARRMLKRLVRDGYAYRTSGVRPVYSLTTRFAALAARALTQHAHRSGHTGSLACDEPPCLVLVVDLLSGHGRSAS